MPSRLRTQWLPSLGHQFPIGSMTRQFCFMVNASTELITKDHAALPGSFDWLLAKNAVRNSGRRLLSKTIREMLEFIKRTHTNTKVHIANGVWQFSSCQLL